MKLKFLILILFPAIYVFPGKIGLLCYSERPFNTSMEHPNELIKLFQDQNHIAEMVCFDQVSDEELDSYDVLLSIVDFPLLTRHLKKTIMYVFEPQPITPNLARKKYLEGFHKVFTWNYEFCDNKKFFKGFFPLYEGVQPSFKAFDERILTCLISSYLIVPHSNTKELYTERKRIAEFYDKNCPSDLSLYGSRGWDRLNLEIFKGKCQNKHSILRNHKFCFCYENWDNDHYYISEKILHCLQNRCVPIYLGSSKIAEYIPKDAFIDARDFSSVEEIHTFISTMSEETWLGYIRAIEAFDRSTNSDFFRKEYYLESVSNEVFKSLENIKK